MIKSNQYKEKMFKINSLFNENHILAAKMKYDKVGLYSFTNQQITNDICNTILTLPDITINSIITDATSSVGGMVMPLLKHFNNINAVEINKNRFKMLCNNIHEYIKYSNISPNISLYCVNWLSINKYLQNDVVLIDAPWMTPDMINKKIWYKNINKLHLYLIGNDVYNKEIVSDSPDKSIIDIEDIVVDISNRVKYVILKVPYNFDFNSFNSKIKNIYEYIKIDDYHPPNSMHIIYLKSLTLCKS